VNSRDPRQSLSNYMIYIQLFVAIKQRYPQCRCEYIRTSPSTSKNQRFWNYFFSSGSTVIMLSDLNPTNL